jgi:hypothetical protein
LRWLRRSKELAVEFCDRCAHVCHAVCRADAVREQALAKALPFGVRF